MNGLEDIAFQAGEITGDFQRVVQLGDIGPGRTAEGDRHLAYNDVAGLLANPVAENRVELGAMRATIAEELQHLDLCRILGRLRRRDRRVVLAGNLGGDGQGKGSRSNQRGTNETATSKLHA